MNPDKCKPAPHANPAGTADGEAWQAWFDGSALPNPGKIGVGVVLLSPAGERLEKSALPGHHGCNNQAELYALCAALELAHSAGARHLLIFGDSDVAVSYVNGTASTAIAELNVLVAQARAWAGRFDSVQLRWLPRHRNGDADRLCRQALGLPDKPAVHPGKKPGRRHRQAALR